MLPHCDRAGVWTGGFHVIVHMCTHANICIHKQSTHGAGVTIGGCHKLMFLMTWFCVSATAQMSMAHGWVWMHMDVYKCKCMFCDLSCIYLCFWSHWVCIVWNQMMDLCVFWYMYSHKCMCIYVCFDVSVCVINVFYCLILLIRPHGDFEHQ